MQNVQLGKSSMWVSKLCLGTMTFGKMNEEKDAYAIMDRARELGVTFFDTANIYGGGPGYRGRVEEFIGKWFKQGDGRRDEIVLGTKFAQPMEDASDGANDALGVSAFKMRRSLERSLKRLGTDHVELYTMHHVDRTNDWAEIWGAYENLIAAGKVYYAGSSNFAAWDLVRAQYEAEKRHFLGNVVEQHKFNLFCRLPELEVLPAAKAMGVGIAAYNPLAGGYLGENALNPKAGTRSAGNNMYAASMGVFNQGQHREQLIQFEKLCHELGLKQSDVALAWVVNNPMVNVVVIGPRTVEQLEACVKASEIKLDEATLQKLDEIFPGPGDAPKAYAF